jgi:hypothetical protein
LVATTAPTKTAAIVKIAATSVAGPWISGLNPQYPAAVTAASPATGALSAAPAATPGNSRRSTTRMARFPTTTCTQYAAANQVNPGAIVMVTPTTIQFSVTQPTVSFDRIPGLPMASSAEATSGDRHPTVIAPL